MVLPRSVVVYGSLLLLLTAGAAVSQDGEPTKPVRKTPVPEALPPVPTDTSWYPFELQPPFRSELVEEDSSDLIHAGNAVFPVDDPPAVPAELSRPVFVDGVFQPGYFLVHFEEALRAEDKTLLDALTGPVRRADGSALARWYVPNNTLVAYVPDATVYALLEAAETIDWIGRYEPAYKLDPTIGTIALTDRDRLGRLFYRLDVDLIPGHPSQDVATRIASLGATVLERVELRGAKTYDVSFLVVDATPNLVTRIAQIEGVRTIQERGDGVKLYDVSGGGKLQNRTLSADDQSASPIVTSSTFPLWLTHNLQGQGQLVGIVDTSMDWNNVGTSGCNSGFPDTAIQNYGFADPVLSSLLLPSVGAGGVTLKVPRADILGGATLLGIAANEHGVGVAGAAAADFYGNNANKWWEHDPDTWEPWSPSNYSGLLGPGIAHEAQIYFTPVMDSSNNFRWEFVGEFETNMNITLDNMAATGVSATNHSVGLAEANNTYTQVTVVHDTNGFDHQDMLQCMAAGNDGAVANALSSQAVTKNAMTVGASDDVLKPEDRVTFSSIGPRFDGALKPDVMAPGHDTAARDGGVQSFLILPNSNGSSSASCAYQYTSGTSFSSPTITGAAALVHQYFEEGRYGGQTPITDPSAALMKAMLINGGHRLTGANLGNGQYPNDYQGWGEPNLSDVLDFGGSRTLVAIDVPSSSGFTSSGSANDVHTVTVDGSSERLRVTLVWTDEPGSTGQGKKLINDLDLRVTAPGGALYRGNVINGGTGESTTGGSADTLNNVENVILSNPATGAWSITVDPGAGNYSVGQGYALVVTGDVTEGGGGGPSAPVADFTGSPTNGVAPLTVNFTSLSTGSIDTYAWSFGDTGTSNLENPSHTYTSPGNYTVSLTVTGPGGTDTETKTNYITVDPPPTGGDELYYLSFTSNTTVPGLGTVRDEDVVTYDPSTDTWAWYFDGSDVGIGGTDINALHVLDDGTLVLSFNSSTFSVPGLVGGPSGTTVEDSDLVLFNFSGSPGSSTSGTFQFIFDGSDVGLTTNGEDIDGIYEFPGGGLAISTLGSSSVPGLGTFRDEDVAFFAATQFGSTTIGTWSMQFDGSDVGFNNSGGEDLDAVAFDNGVDMLYSTVGDYSAAGASGADEDVGRFQGTFGSATSGSASMELDLSALGISTGEDVDGLAFK